MNPEDNNPLANPGTPGLGSSATPASGANSLSMADSLASAEDNLTSAGLAASGQTSNNNLTQLGDSGSAVKSPFAPVDEPLTPAAPVPGSIGSATSGPALSTPASPTMPNVASSATSPLSSVASASPFAHSHDTSSTSPAAASSPMTSATTATSQPYNPFAAPTTSSNFTATSPAGTTSTTSTSSTSAATAASPASNTATTGAPVNPFNGATRPASGPMPAPAVNPAFQPSPKSAKKSKDPQQHSNLLPIILGGVAALMTVLAIVFAIMYFNAVNNPKVVYVPSVSDEQSNSTVSSLSCSREGDFGYLLGENPRFVAGTEQLTANYVDSTLSGVTLDTTVAFGNEEEANTARAQLEAYQAELANLIAGSFTTEYAVNGSTLEAKIASIEGQLSEADANALLYGNNSAYASTPVDLDSVEAYYSANGYVCVAE